MKSIYLIKDLAKVSGCSTHTLKFYLRLGLLKEIGRSPETKFRYFDDSSCERLMKIRALQRKKMSLKEIYNKLEGKERKSSLVGMILISAFMTYAMPCIASADVPPLEQVSFESFIAAQASTGQEPEEELDLIIDEALDQIEKSGDIPKPSSGSGDAPRQQDTAATRDGIEVTGEIMGVPDKAPEGEVKTETISLLYAEASGIIAALDQIKSPDGTVVYDEDERTLTLMDTAGKVDAMSAYVRKVDILLETEIFKLKYIGTADVVQDVQKALTQGIGQIKLDEPAKSIVVTDTPAAVGHIKEMINAKDRFNKEIHIATKILQIVLNDEHTMGVDWEAIVSDYQSLEFSGFTSGSDGQDGGKLSLGVVSKEDYGILLEALDTVGADRTISEEEIKTEPAQRQAVKILSVDLRGKEEDRGTGEYINFYVTASVNADGTRMVSVEPELIGGRSGRSPSEKKPSVNLQVKNEAVIVVGSLFENVKVASTWKIPLLGDLPLLGFVFRNEGEEERRAEIITFLTVKIVDKK